MSMLVWHRTKQYRKATEDERLKYYVEKKEKELYCFSSEVSRSFGSAQYTLKWEQSVGCFFFSLGISRYYYVCFEFGTAIRQRQLNLTVSDFRPFAVIIYRPATVANEKKIVYFMECVCFSRCCCIQFLPCRFIRAPLLNLMPLVL